MNIMSKIYCLTCKRYVKNKSPNIPGISNERSIFSVYCYQ